jgi:hypothetical protein
MTVDRSVMRDKHILLCRASARVPLAWASSVYPCGTSAGFNLRLYAEALASRACSLVAMEKCEDWGVITQ